METLVVDAQFWQNKRVLLTGHTGFKGSWLSLWLQKLGATVAGYALPAAPSESLFHLARVAEHMESVYADIRDLDPLRALTSKFQPDIVFHLAAQPLVRQSYLQPVETFAVNVMGTVHLLEALRNSHSCRVIVIVTSDKCYENREWVWGYRESDPVGGHDPYSSSKGCAELVTAAYRNSFLERRKLPIAVATARAGNVIGGGDFSNDRLIPDIMAAVRNRKTLIIRNPDAVRPWQHVLEPLSGYLLLAEKLWNSPQDYAQSWNFGPTADDTRPVRWVIEKLNDHWGGSISWELNAQPNPHEARLLMLDSAKARTILGWRPRLTLESALSAVVSWYKAYERNEPLRALVLQQISFYEALADPRP